MSQKPANGRGPFRRSPSRRLNTDRPEAIPGLRKRASETGLDALSDASRTHCPTAVPVGASMSEPTKPNGGTSMTRMNRHVDVHLADAHGNHSFDRRTLVIGAAGALVAAALGGSARAADFASSARPVARAQFDPALTRRLQQVLDDAV